MDRVNAYISLLFLTVDSDYDLRQDEFYGDLYVVRCPSSTQQIEEDEDEDDDNIYDAVNSEKSPKNIFSEKLGIRLNTKAKEVQETDSDEIGVVND